MVNYTAVAVQNDREYGGSRNFSFVVGEDDPLVRRCAAACTSVCAPLCSERAAPPTLCPQLSNPTLLQIVQGWTRAILGGEGLPAVERGGIRTIRIPPSLAFGARGNACIFGLETKCLVPPNSPVDITFEYLGFK